MANSHQKCLIFFADENPEDDKVVPTTKDPNRQTELRNVDKANENPSSRADKRVPIDEDDIPDESAQVVRGIKDLVLAPGQDMSRIQWTEMTAADSNLINLFNLSTIPKMGMCFRFCVDIPQDRMVSRRNTRR